MSYFPFVENIEVEEVENDLPIYSEIAWDFKENVPIVENGEFKKVYENEAIKVWCCKALLVPRYDYSIYSFDYGSELMDLIGKAYSKSLTKVEAKRYIEEALLINPYITEVEITDVSFIDDKLTVNISLETVYGKTEVIL